MSAKRAAAAALFLSLIGLAICVYLEYLHLGLLRGELTGGLGCGGTGSAFNCHAVTGSRFGHLLGIPLALWGAFGYLVTLTLSWIALKFPDWAEKALLTITALVVLFVLGDLLLLTAMITQIHYFCTLCLASYAVNLLLLIVAKGGARKPWSAVFSASAIEPWTDTHQPLATTLWSVALVAATGVVSINSATLFIARGSPAAFKKQLTDFLHQQAQQAAIDTLQDPTIGPANAPVQMVEFSDFLCPSCQRAWKFNPILLAAHRHDVVFSFKNFPLDPDCNRSVQRPVHPGACRVASAGECAHEQGKFSEFQDRVFTSGPEYKVNQIEQDASELGLDMARFKSCMESGRGTEAVKRDVEDAIRLNVTRTPTYVFNGIPVEGSITPVMFEPLLEQLPPRK